VARSVPDAAGLAAALGALPRRPSVLEPMANTMDAPRSISAKKKPEYSEISAFFAAHSGAAGRTLSALPEALATARATSR